MTSYRQQSDRGHIFETPLTGSRVDREAGVIRGVSVITEGPARGHFDMITGLPVMIDGKTLEQVKACAETYLNGLKVKADHQSGIFSTTGYLKNFRIEGDRLRADLYTLATDENREKLLEMAEQIPDTFGLSVAFSGKDEMRPDMVLARCLEIYSADLVPEPAANPTGLFTRKVDAKNKETDIMATDNKAPAPAAGSEKAPESDLLAQCKAMLEATSAEYNTRLAKLEAAISALNPKAGQADKTGDGDADEDDKLEAATSGDGVTGSNSNSEKPEAGKQGDFAAIRQEIRELAAQVEAIPQKLAKEFAGKMGLSTATVSPIDSAAAPATKTENPAANFLAIVQKHFAATKSKARAMSLAIAEDEKEHKGEGYREFMAKPQPVIYEKKA